MSDPVRRATVQSVLDAGVPALTPYVALFSPNRVPVVNDPASLLFSPVAPGGPGTPVLGVCSASHCGAISE